ncbi:hypothetical protein [Hydrogenophaga sp. PAMC20947]|uniref:hypothetical protein n=1 Tax=Hydrogenophaga sp. PAMC20947 TaxID=2565558 RepID=UPI00144575F1|nr:hypothetical protein [Hydrogenophaga sp. PAMC20947]
MKFFQKLSVNDLLGFRLAQCTPDGTKTQPGDVKPGSKLGGADGRKPGKALNT